MSSYNELQLSSFMDQVFERLRAIEAQLAILSEKAGVPYEEPTKNVSEQVMEQVRAGDRIGAIRTYRELTGCGLAEAQEAIAKL